MTRYTCRCCVITVPCTMDDGTGARVPSESSKPELCPFDVGTPQWEMVVE